jgi:hypothetical protein
MKDFFVVVAAGVSLLVLEFLLLLPLEKNNYLLILNYCFSLFLLYFIFIGG